MGLVGPGFIAAHHIDAVRRLGDIDILGIAGSNLESAQRRAVEMNVPRAYAAYQELIDDPAIHVVHNTTPNYMHLPVTLAALKAGKHVVSDKPLAMTPAECIQLRDAAAAAGVVNAVTFNYRGNPLVQEARVRIANGDIGEVVYIHGQYLQDWMTDENVYSWRMDVAKGGESSALADIGSHWCDLAEHMSGRRIVSVLADINTVVKTRYSSGASKKAFDKSVIEDRFPVPVHGEDLGTVLLRFDDGTRGCLQVGQVLPGHKNDLQIEINGRGASIGWKQEEQNELWIGRHNRANEILMKAPDLMLPETAHYAHLPSGHQESWADAFRNVISDIYDQIRGDITGPVPPTICTFADATRTSCIVDAMLRSAAAGGVWTSVAHDTVAP